jgi:hypothetical protein
MLFGQTPSPKTQLVLRAQESKQTRLMRSAMKKKNLRVVPSLVNLLA